MFVASARTARGGANVWTSHGLGTRLNLALRIDPQTSDTFYAAANGVAVEFAPRGWS